MSWLLPPALWALTQLSRPAWNLMQQQLQQPEQTQRQLLARLLAAAGRSRHGRRLGLSGPGAMAAFEQLEPMAYEALRSTVDADMATGGNSFSAQAVRYYERTSGSSGTAKAIPYNRALLGSFDRLFRIWAYDLLRAGLTLNSGKTFMSVSPPLLGQGATPHGVAVGSQDDTDYVSGAMAALLRPFLVAPAAALRLTSAEDFKDVLAVHLLAENRLEVVSVWNPTFWLLLLEHMRESLDRLAPALLAGKLERGGLVFRFAPLSPARLAAIAQVPRHGWRAVWPQLQLISCWDEATAARPAAQLRDLFSGVMVQGKGLLATEGPMTVPLQGAPAPVPLLGEVYLELQLADGSLRPLWQWREGDEGELVVSQAGGLIRYCLRDRVAVAGMHSAAPCLRFLGRAGRGVDLVGEKLSEAFVQQLLAETGSRAGLLCLCPLEQATPACYALLSDVAEAGLAERLDAALMAAPHYRLARALGQLGPLRAVCRPDMAALLHGVQQARGMQAGNIKDVALLCDLALAQQVALALAQP
ncbi:hypothetical protein GCM10007907_23850 [Chitinimonas prasina]|uniref:GH3 middle domain-containing protein n=1 Tax=Chitinimonas prasina TaxID=1434937 RepID=A0ABQ5YF28_9NEIS|nr:GH3 auxin-responsive promoter family protein [Chitinimonas prasina]GLR13595.1 hypothetical protein GCM10007907_23850 [Chitinimonas prasina]